MFSKKSRTHKSYTSEYFKYGKISEWKRMKRNTPTVVVPLCGWVTDAFCLFVFIVFPLLLKSSRGYTCYFDSYTNVNSNLNCKSTMNNGGKSNSSPRHTHKHHATVQWVSAAAKERRLCLRSGARKTSGVLMWKQNLFMPHLSKHILGIHKPKHSPLEEDLNKHIPKLSPQNKLVKQAGSLPETP